MARGILIAAACVYVVLVLIRIFYTGDNMEGLKDVWEYSKVFLSSIFFFVLGIFFHHNQHSKT